MTKNARKKIRNVIQEIYCIRLKGFSHPWALSTLAFEFEAIDAKCKES